MMKQLMGGSSWAMRKEHRLSPAIGAEEFIP
jgi:hypothetical protein